MLPKQETDPATRIVLGFGEYHTIVTNCPRFSAPLAVVTGQSVPRGDCWALDARRRERIGPGKITLPVRLGANQRSEGR
jgi:hypothetical protein